MLDLASMASAKSDDEKSLVSTATTAAMSLEEGETAEVSLGLTHDSVGTDLSDMANRVAKKSSSATVVGKKPVIEGDKSSVPTNPAASPSTKKGKASSYGQYTGFANDYADYEEANMTYDLDPYAPTVFGKKEGSSLWCCLMPWVPPSLKDKATTEGIEEPLSENAAKGLSKSSEDADETASTGSDVYGEKLTDKEQKAVLARLRLPQPEAAETILSPDAKPSSPRPEEPTETKTSTEDAAPPTKHRSILKRTSAKANTAAALVQKKMSMTEAGSRRSLFPQYEKKGTKVKHDKHVSFAPMARVVTVKARADMSFLEKSQVWWQKKDYDDFKKTGRIIAKAMLEGGSEVWLATNKSWQAPIKRVSALPAGSSRSKSDAVSQPRAYHMSERGGIQREQVPGENASTDDTGMKWWCTFGHSRRGLEHIASINEGRERQANVKTAIRMVVDEQRRQRIYRKEDSEKLRMVSLQYTSWARDLSLAAALADSEAVRSNFSQEAKSREFYLLKQAKANDGNARHSIPSFMTTPAPTVPPQLLDANTSSQIRYRRSQVVPVSQLAPRTSQSSLVSNARSEVVRDTAQSKMAKKAAGFGIENKNMSAVLSGMGAMGDDGARISATSITAAPQTTRVGAH